MSPVVTITGAGRGPLVNICILPRITQSPTMITITSTRKHILTPKSRKVSVEMKEVALTTSVHDQQPRTVLTSSVPQTGSNNPVAGGAPAPWRSTRLKAHTVKIDCESRNQAARVRCKERHADRRARAGARAPRAGLPGPERPRSVLPSSHRLQSAPRPCADTSRSS